LKEKIVEVRCDGNYGFHVLLEHLGHSEDNHILIHLSFPKSTFEMIGNF